LDLAVGARLEGHAATGGRGLSLWAYNYGADITRDDAGVVAWLNRLDWERRMSTKSGAGGRAGVNGRAGAADSVVMKRSRGGTSKTGSPGKVEDRETPRSLPKAGYWELPEVPRMPFYCISLGRGEYVGPFRLRRIAEATGRRVFADDPEAFLFGG